MGIKKIDRAIKHKVEHIYSNRNHLFKSGKHNVFVGVTCDCKYQSVQGTANNKFCSHILATMRRILEDEGFKVDKGGKN